MKSWLVIVALLLVGGQSGRASGPAVQDLSILGHHYSTAVLGLTSNVSVKDPSTARVLILKASASAADRRATVFAPDFVLAYTHENGTEDRADCIGIAPIDDNGSIGPFRTGQVPRLSLTGEKVRFALAFIVESDVEAVDLHVLGRPAPVAYRLGTSRPYSVYVTTNRAAEALSGAEQALRDGGYYFDSSLGLKQGTSGLVIIHHPQTEAVARDISARLMLRLKVEPKLKTFAQEGVNAAEYDVLVWVGK